MTDAQNILRDEFKLDFSLPYVCRLVRDLGFNYGSPRPKFKEEPENAEEIEAVRQLFYHVNCIKI